MASSLFNRQQQGQAGISNQIIAKARQLMVNINSPEMKMINNLLNGKGMSAEQAVRDICQKQGINVDEFMSQLK